MPDQTLHDLDDRQNLESYMSRLQKPDCYNLAVEFSPSVASAGLNLSAMDVRRLLARRKQQSTSTCCLWINLWGWTEEHQAIIQEVAKHYDMSPRLAHAMCPRSQPTAAVPAPLNTQPGAGGFASLRSMLDVVSKVWHFATIDFGRQYICLGWNALFFLPHTQESPSQNKPNADRIWSTVLLCHDGTVVSVFENPSTTGPGVLLRTRQNQINVFRNLSKANGYAQGALMETPIRPDAIACSDLVQVSAEMAGLLFYYLFDDWINLFKQVSGSDDSYRHQLESLRDDMFQRPSSEQINVLHQLGKQLGAIRSVCKSYLSLIEQLVRHQPIDAANASNANQSATAKHRIPEFFRLPFTTGARFERLLSRIDLCAMTELDDCIAEKEGLVQMNFNLSNLREAQTVERLTRTTILLAKFTILFLPVSLATSYFSMQLKDIENTPLHTYWATFAIVMAVTVGFLVGFDFLSSRYSGVPVYSSLVKTFLDRRLGRKKLPNSLG